MRRRWWSACGAALALFPGGAAAGEDPVLLLRGFHADQVREVRFQLRREVEATLSGVGAGARTSLYAYGWLHDDQRNRVAWSMLEAEPEEESGPTLRFREQLSLAPGRYTLRYFAGSRHRATGAGGIRSLLDRRSANPAAWHVALSLPGREREALEASPAAGPEADTDVIRLAPLGDSITRRVRFRVPAPSQVSLLALGEMVSRQFADRSYLLRLDTRETVWSMEPDSTVHAGGAGKNRMASRTLDLEPGGYELVAATDSSHSADGWNALPPYQPDAWGVTLRAPSGSLRLDDVPAERVIARLAGVGDEERLEAGFRLDRATAVRVYCFGEWSSGHGILADYGWIERKDAETVWKMSYQGSMAAGGSSKNRVTDQVITLPAGSYRAIFLTDDSHSFPDWNADAPDDPRSWGISLSTFEPEATFALTDLQASHTGGGHSGKGFKIKIR